MSSRQNVYFVTGRGDPVTAFYDVRGFVPLYPGILVSLIPNVSGGYSPDAEYRSYVVMGVEAAVERDVLEGELVQDFTYTVEPVAYTKYAAED